MPISPPKKFKEKKLGQLENEAKAMFQKWVVLRDRLLPCISCNLFKTLQGGHFFKAELFSGLIFDERNVNGQCEHCNCGLDGNVSEYRKGLLRRFGNEFVEQLEAESNLKRFYKFTKGELIGIRVKYEIKIKEILKNG